jgi:ferritin-like metal-binding protein YciE
MTKTASRAALLHVAVQDLHAGKLAQAERLPAIADAARGPELRALLEGEAGRAKVQAERLAVAGGDMNGPGNLWIAGILDDAERDAGSHEPGPLLDVALVGAVRKAKAAEIVSGETARARARVEGQAAIAAAVAANRDEEIAADRALKERLAALTS